MSCRWITSTCSGGRTRPWRDAVFADHESTLVAECTKLHFSQAVKLVDVLVSASRRRSRRGACRAPARAVPTCTRRPPSMAMSCSAAYSTRSVGPVVHRRNLPASSTRCTSPTSTSAIVRTACQRRAAALVEMSRRSAAASITHRRPKPLFTVLLGEDSFAGLCELANGQVIAPGALSPWLSDADMETVLFDGPTTIISVSSPAQLHRGAAPGDRGSRPPLPASLRLRRLRRSMRCRPHRAPRPARRDQPVQRPVGMPDPQPSRGQARPGRHASPRLAPSPASTSYAPASAGATSMTIRRTTMPRDGPYALRDRRTTSMHPMRRGDGAGHRRAGRCRSPGRCAATTPVPLAARSTIASVRDTSPGWSSRCTTSTGLPTDPFDDLDHAR